MAELNDYQPIDDAIKSLSNGTNGAHVNGNGDLPDWLKNELNIHNEIEPVAKPKREDDLRWLDSFNQPKSTPQQALPTMRIQNGHNAPIINERPIKAPLVEEAEITAEEPVEVELIEPMVSQREEVIEEVDEVAEVDPLQTPEDPDEYLAWLEANKKKKMVVKSAAIDHSPMLNREERIQINGAIGNGKNGKSGRVNTKSELGWMKNYYKSNGTTHSNGKSPQPNGNGSVKKSELPNGKVNGHAPDPMAWLDELADKDGKAIREELSD